MVNFRQRFVSAHLVVVVVVAVAVVVVLENGASFAYVRLLNLLTQPKILDTSVTDT
jgi:hypothetical protein